MPVCCAIESRGDGDDCGEVNCQPDPTRLSHGRSGEDRRGAATGPPDHSLRAALEISRKQHRLRGVVWRHRSDEAGRRLTARVVVAVVADGAGGARHTGPPRRESASVPVQPTRPARGGLEGAEGGRGGGRRADKADGGVIHRSRRR